MPTEKHYEEFTCSRCGQRQTTCVESVQEWHDNFGLVTCKHCTQRNFIHSRWRPGGPLNTEAAK